MTADYKSVFLKGKENYFDANFCTDNYIEFSRITYHENISPACLITKSQSRLCLITPQRIDHALYRRENIWNERIGFC